MLPPIRQEVAALSVGCVVVLPSHESLASCPEEFAFHSFGLANRGFHHLHMFVLTPVNAF